MQQLAWFLILIPGACLLLWAAIYLFGFMLYLMNRLVNSEPLAVIFTLGGIALLGFFILLFGGYYA